MTADAAAVARWLKREVRAGRLSPELDVAATAAIAAVLVPHNGQVMHASRKKKTARGSTPARSMQEARASGRPASRV